MAYVIILSGCVSGFRTVATAYDYVGSGFKFNEENDDGLILLEFPYIAQSKYSLCGPTALVSVMAYYGNNNHTGYLIDAYRNDTQWDLAQLSRDAEERGFESFIVRGSNKLLLKWIHNGWPVLIVLEQPLGGKHMVAIIGYHKKKEYWVMADPAYGFRQMNVTTLTNRWKYNNYASLIILPKKEAANAVQGKGGER